MERLGILEKTEYCIFAAGGHDAAQTAKSFETAVVSDEMGDAFHQAFG